MIKLELEIVLDRLLYLQAKLQLEPINRSTLLFTNVSSIFMLTIACRDVGKDCDCIVSGENEEELFKNAAEHAVKDHGYRQEDIMTPEMQEKIKSHIRRV